MVPESVLFQMILSRKQLPASEIAPAVVLVKVLKLLFQPMQTVLLFAENIFSSSVF